MLKGTYLSISYIPLIWGTDTSKLALAWKALICLFICTGKWHLLDRKKRTNSRAREIYTVGIQRDSNLANQFTPPIMDGNVGLIVIFIVLSSLVFTANFTVCMLVYLRKSMRTYTNGFVVSLAFSDLLIGSVLIPTWLIFPDSSAVLGYVVSITLLSGVFNLTAVTFDRYIAVIKALQYENFMRKSFTRMIYSSWLASLSISFIPLIWGTDTSKLAHKIFVISELSLCVLLPYLLIFTGYFKIFQQVKRSVRREREITASVRKTMNQKDNLSSEAKLAQVFIIVAVMFVLSWLPIQYMTILYEIGRADLIPDYLRFISLVTVALGSLINPIVYSFLKPDFRKSIRHILCHRKRKRFGSSGTWARGGSSNFTATSSLKARLTTSIQNAASTRVWRGQNACLTRHQWLRVPLNDSREAVNENWLCIKPCYDLFYFKKLW